MNKLLNTGFILTLATVSTLALADHTQYKRERAAQYEVTITNLSPSQSFTPQLVVTHSTGGSLFTLGQAASAPLEALAEGGATGPLTDALAAITREAKTIDGLLGPGQSTTTTISGDLQGSISVAAMMLPTNDNFIALNGVKLPYWGTVTHLVPAYDAGTEYNDQSCQHIPGPRCGGTAFSAASETDEGFVHISSGFHERGAVDAEGFEVLSPADYDWKNPTAKITIRRIH